ncbi:large repetitive protein [Amycolatopsis japonica]|uniref:large repetitive protein n=1 Tax=Amycolatopsis japonica TaxID=208439 RepID=UPI00366F1A2D
MSEPNPQLALSKFNYDANRALAAGEAEPRRVEATRMRVSGPTTSPAGQAQVGQYVDRAPALDPAQYSTIEALATAVSDLINPVNGSATTAWYDLETDFKAAEGALNSVNEAFAKQIKAVGDALEGETGESFKQYATAVLNTSEQVYDTVTGKQFGTNIGGIGRAVQSFVTTWRQLQSTAEQVYEERVSALRADTQRKIQASETVEEISAHTTNLSAGLANIKTTSDAALLKDLQNALGKLGNEYSARCAELVPLYISDGNTATAAPPGSYQAGGGGATPGQQMQQAEPRRQDEFNPENVEQQTPNSLAPSEYNAQPTQEEVGPNGQPNGTASPGAVDPGETPATGGAGEGLPGRIEANGPTTGGGGVSPETQAALGDAKQAAGQAIDDLTKQTDDPSRQAALQDAKEAAQGAIDGLTGGAGSGPGGTEGTQDPSAGMDPSAGTGPGTGAGGGLGSPVPGLAEAKQAAGKAIDDLSKKTDDPKRKQALEDAKKAAEDAIDGLTSPTAPGALTGGPDAPTADEAKEAVNGAIDDLAKPGDTEAQQQALEDAKKAASEAVDGALGQGKDGTDPAAAADRQQLLDAKEAAKKAIDDLICETDDPERKAALEEAKEAMGAAIDKVAAPEHFQQVEDAKLAAEKAIDGLGTSSDDAQRQQALEAAKAAANDAIDRINDSPELTGPEHDQALAQAKEDAAKAIDGLAQPDDTPAERQELADAKAAANKAIDSIGATQGGTGGGSGGTMRDFLAPSAGSGGSGGTGSTGVAPATAGGPSPGKFDTQPLSASGPMSTQGGPSPAGAPAGVGAGQQGMPMGPMGGAPMGGAPMGGGQGGQGGEQKEREPQVWTQAPEDAWSRGEDDGLLEGRVLGRS